MGKGTRRRNGKARGKEKRRSAPPAGPTSVHDLPGELLDRVLLHLGSRLHLVRAAATCRRWRRAVADEGFLARFGSLNGAAGVAGHYYVPDPLPPNAAHRLRQPPKTPGTFVPAVPAVVDGGAFSLDFLYAPPGEDDRPRRVYLPASRVRHNRRREIVDSRGSLLLLNNGPWSFMMFSWRQRSPDLIVCEPVTRRYQGIPRLADFSHLLFLGAFLLDGGGGGGDAMSNFRVLSVLYECGRVRSNSGTARAFVFTPGCDGGWHLGWRPTEADVELPSVDMIDFAGRVAGRIYWGIETGTVLVLDEETLKFSIVTFPDHMRWPYRRTSFRVIGGVGNTVRVVRMDGEDLQVFGRLPGSEHWLMEKSVRLKDAAARLSGWDDKLLVLPARIVTAGDTFVVLTPAEETRLFSVELETMELEREHERNQHVGPAYPCALPWPPVLRACVDHGGVAAKRGATQKGLMLR
ncbi:hypothetical protein ACP70R_006576 [Stipagrostis hirtigluma subsp. patula]